MLSNKHSVVEVLIQKDVKTIMQTLHDKKLFDNYDSADPVLKDFLFVETCRPDLEELNDVIQ